MTFSYTITTIFLSIMLVFLLISSMVKLKNNPHRSITGILIAVTFVYVILDWLWLQDYNAESFNRSRFIIVNFLFYLTYITLPYVWFLFAQSFIGDELQDKRFILATAVPWLFNFVLIVTSCFGQNTVWIIGDALNRYQRGRLFTTFSGLNYVYYIVPFIEIVVIMLFRESVNKLRYLAVLAFTLIPSLGLMIYNVFINATETNPFQTLCYFFGILVAYIFIINVQQRMDDRRNVKKFEKAMLEAKAANEAKTTFLQHMSHDIRTPLNAMTGYTIMSKKYITDPEKVEEYLDQIDLAGQRILVLINQIMEMTRLESGKAELAEKPVNIQLQFKELVDFMIGQAKTEGLIFKNEIDIQHGYVYSDSARVTQILMNVADNAMKFTPEGGTVQFTLKERTSEEPDDRAYYTFTIRDNGIGMSKAFLDRLFEPFSMERSSTIAGTKGNGLGLSIVKGLTDLMDGTIEVNSTPGKGTTVEITLPFRIIEEADWIGKEDRAWDMKDFEGRRVLLVDDNKMNRDIINDILKENGMLTETAEDGNIAVDMVRDITARQDYHFYDFILMDIQMPRMDGYEATRKIRELPWPEDVHIPIIAMTASALAEDRDSALEAGMDEHIVKPIDITAMWATLAQFL